MSGGVELWSPEVQAGPRRVLDKLNPNRLCLERAQRVRHHQLANRPDVIQPDEPDT
ncbi:MAG: hypothetical protein AB1449_08545 [Chloroflexota bacterium]